MTTPKADPVQLPTGWPRASVSASRNGWTLDYKFLEKVEALARNRTEYSTSMEATEQVLIAALEVLAVAPKAEPVPAGGREELREGASYESMNLAAMVLSDCGHSSNYKPLLERVAGRIDRHVDRLLTAQRADLTRRAQAAPASQDAEDAARYRHLKKYKTWDSTDVFYWLRCAPADEVDSIIDAARAAHKEGAMNPYESGAVIDMNMGHNSATPAAPQSLLSFAPQLGSCDTPEPSLSALIYRYYRTHVDDRASADAMARDYVRALADAAPQPAVQQGDVSPTMPRDIEMMATNRYRPVPSGVLAYKVVGGDGNRSLFSGTKDECQIVARKLTEAFLDGAYVALSTHPAAPAAQGDALPREDFAWMVVQEACETEPADEDDPECIRILRRDLKSAVLAAFLREDAARAQQEHKQ